eukprot:TRINITY_DN6632_c0_g1_i1.p1 TRINITY_DN6632_c0_g1~~TRINITY_DN6632_c0_g1_i1.p1  ORF type:complete len:117 (-),score=44.70 TRINITY_DN6632_c0_g1_i1:86-385(-)
MAQAPTGPIARTIFTKLTNYFKPVQLKIIDESSQHASHVAMRGQQSIETHFKVEMVSEKFEGMNIITRHRQVYGILDEELKTSVHALSLKLKTPSELNL